MVGNGAVDVEEFCGGCEGSEVIVFESGDAEDRGTGSAPIKVDVRSGWRDSRA